MTTWHTLAAGPELRRLVAERLGWHMRKTWVGTSSVEYDYLIYNEDDMLMYQREIGSAEASDAQQAETDTWLEAMRDEDCPRWDEDLLDARDLVYGLDHAIEQQDGQYHAWVDAPQHQGAAPTEALALVRAWLTATENQDDFLSPT